MPNPLKNTQQKVYKNPSKINEISPQNSSDNSDMMYRKWNAKNLTIYIDNQKISITDADPLPESTKDSMFIKEFSSNEDLQKFFETNLLKQIPPEERAVALEKLMSLAHQGGLRNPVSEATSAHMKENHQLDLVASSSNEHLVRFTTTNTGFKIEETTAQAEMVDASSRQKIKSDSGANPYCYKVYGKLDVDFLKKEPEQGENRLPVITIEENTIQFGNKLLEKQFSAELKENNPNYNDPDKNLTKQEAIESYRNKLQGCKNRFKHQYGIDISDPSNDNPLDPPENLKELINQLAVDVQILAREPSRLSKEELQDLSQALEYCTRAMSNPESITDLSGMEKLSERILNSAEARESSAGRWKKIGLGLAALAGVSLIVFGVLASAPTGGASLSLVLCGLAMLSGVSGTGAFASKVQADALKESVGHQKNVASDVKLFKDYKANYQKQATAGGEPEQPDQQSNEDKPRFKPS